MKRLLYTTRNDLLKISTELKIECTLINIVINNLECLTKYSWLIIVAAFTFTTVWVAPYGSFIYLFLLTKSVIIYFS